MNKYLCLNCGSDFFDVTGNEILCPVCGEKHFRCLGLVNEQVHPAMRDYVNMAVKPLRMHNYYPNSERDGL